MVKETYYIAKETYYIARGRRDLNESGIAFQVTNPMPIPCLYHSLNPMPIPQPKPYAFQVTNPRP